MLSLSSWDSLFDMPGNVDLECILNSFNNKMAPPVVKYTRKISKSSVQEIQQALLPTIYVDTTCNINKKTKLSWFEIYAEFVK